MRAIGQALGVARHSRKDAILPASIGFDRGWAPLGGNGMASRPAQAIHAINTYGGTDESSSTVFACISLIADTLAGYEWGITDVEGDLLDPSPADASLHELLEEPWPDGTYNDFAGDVQTDLELVGNSYWMNDSMNGFAQPLAVRRLQPQYMKIVTNRKDEKVGYVYRVKGVDIPLGLDDVIHYKLRNPLNAHYGMGTVESIMREIQSDLAQNAHVTAFFQNGARIAGVLTIPDGLDEIQFERLKDEIASEYGNAANAYKMLIAEKSTDYKAITSDPKNMGVVDLRNLAKNDILQGFGVPEFLLGGKAEAGIPKMEQAQYVFYRRMITRAQRFQDRTSLSLASKWEGRKFVLFPELNEPPEQKLNNAKALAEACASPNEVRVAAGLPEIEDERMDMPLLPTALSPLGIVFRAPQSTNPARPSAPGGNTDPNEDPNANQDPAADINPDEVQPIKAPRRIRPKHRKRAHADLKLPPGLPAQVATQPNMAQMLTSMVLSGQAGIVDAAAAVAAEEVVDSTAVEILESVKTYEQQWAEMGGEARQLEAGAPEELKLLIEAPVLPPGYEQRAQLVDPGDADVVHAQMLLQGQAIFFTQATPAFNRAFVTFFNDQRLRVLRGLDEHRAALIRNGKATAKTAHKEIKGDELFASEAEKTLLLATYLEVVDALGEAALDTPRRIVSADVRWDLQHEYVQAARNALAEKVVRVNDTTRQAIADVVDEGVRRGYSIPQIANGQPSDSYKGIQGVFNDATAARAETIARTETAFLFNASANAAYKTKGVQQVYVIDGVGDAICADANNSLWTVEEAEADPLGHPNCVRAFAPKVD